MLVDVYRICSTMMTILPFLCHRAAFQQQPFNSSLLVMRGLEAKIIDKDVIDLTHYNNEHSGYYENYRSPWLVRALAQWGPL